MNDELNTPFSNDELTIVKNKKLRREAEEEKERKTWKGRQVLVTMIRRRKKLEKVVMTITDRLPSHESSRLCFVAASCCFLIGFGDATANAERLASGVLAAISIAFAARTVARSGDPIVLQI